MWPEKVKKNRFSNPGNLNWRSTNSYIFPDVWSPAGLPLPVGLLHDSGPDDRPGHSLEVGLGRRLLRSLRVRRHQVPVDHTLQPAVAGKGVFRGDFQGKNYV